MNDIVETVIIKRDGQRFRINASDYDAKKHGKTFDVTDEELQVPIGAGTGAPAPVVKTFGVVQDGDKFFVVYPDKTRASSLETAAGPVALPDEGFADAPAAIQAITDAGYKFEPVAAV